MTEQEHTPLTSRIAVLDRLMTQEGRTPEQIQALAALEAQVGDNHFSIAQRAQLSELGATEEELQSFPPIATGTEKVEISDEPESGGHPF